MSGGIFTFSDVLNDNVQFLSNQWLNENEPYKKKTFIALIMESVSAKCDNLEHLILIVIIPCHTLSMFYMH